MAIDNNKKINIIALAYKLLADVVFLSLITFSLFLMAESVLPGIISARVDMVKVIVLILALLSAIFYIGKKYSFSFPEIRIKKGRLFLALIILFLPLAILSLLKFGTLEIFIILIATLLILFYIYKLIFS